jgi:hypothetical protein
MFDRQSFCSSIAPQSVNTTIVLIGVLLIIVGAIALATIYRLIDSFLLAIVLLLVLLAAVVGILLYRLDRTRVLLAITEATRELA